MTVTTKKLLLIIDPQVDFISGSLPVPGAEKAMYKLARWIETNPRTFDDIVVTLDSHLPGHVSFISSWGWTANPGLRPVTVNLSNLSGGHRYDPGFVYLGNLDDKFYYTDEHKLLQGKIKNYIATLKDDGLRLWPDHCVIGTPGYQIYKPLLESLEYYSRTTQDPWKIIMKGDDPHIEMYSAVTKGVPGYEGGLKYSVKLDESLLQKYDEIYIAGIARDFCVAETISDLVKYFPELIKGKLRLILDCMPFISEETPEIFNEITAKNSSIMASYYTIPRIKDTFKNFSNDITLGCKYPDKLPKPIEDYMPIPAEDAEGLFSGFSGFNENSVKYDDENGSVYYIKKDWVNSVTTETPETGKE